MCFGVILTPTPTARDLRPLHPYTDLQGASGFFSPSSLTRFVSPSKGQKSCRPTGALGEQTSTRITALLHDSRPCSSKVSPYLHPLSLSFSSNPALPSRCPPVPRKQRVGDASYFQIVSVSLSSATLNWLQFSLSTPTSPPDQTAPKSCTKMGVCRNRKVEKAVLGFCSLTPRP